MQFGANYLPCKFWQIKWIRICTYPIDSVITRTFSSMILCSRTWLGHGSLLFSPSVMNIKIPPSVSPFFPFNTYNKQSYLIVKNSMTGIKDGKKYLILHQKIDFYLTSNAVSRPHDKHVPGHISILSIYSAIVILLPSLIVSNSCSSRSFLSPLLICEKEYDINQKLKKKSEIIFHAAWPNLFTKRLQPQLGLHPEHHTKQTFLLLLLIGQYGGTHPDPSCSEICPISIHIWCYYQVVKFWRLFQEELWHPLESIHQNPHFGGLLPMLIDHSTWRFAELGQTSHVCGLLL